MNIFAEFEFDIGKTADIMYYSLLPELNQDYQRTKTLLELDGTKLILKIWAQDIVSIRAALNGWLRLIKITYDICVMVCV